MSVRVHPRVHGHHPEIAAEDAAAAFDSTLRKVERTDTDPVQTVGVGMDGHGRLLEYIAIEQDNGDWLIFHAMLATTKVMVETGLRRR